jgi:hypothetical protein
MASKQQLEVHAENVLSAVDQTSDKLQQFCLLWSEVVKPVFELVKNFTGPKIDEQLNKLEAAADGVCNGSNPQVQKYCTLWETLHLKALLKMIQFFTGPRVDKVINKFIELSDALVLFEANVQAQPAEVN